MSTANIVFLDAGTIGEDLTLPDFNALGKFTVYDFTAPEEVSARIADADFLLTNKVILTAEHIAAAPKLRYIGTVATGYNQVDIEAAAKRGIPVCNVPAYSSPAVVQHVFTMLLTLASDVCRLGQSVRDGAWSKSPSFSYWYKPITELEGKTFGVVGFGDIGSAVARAAHGFGMKVLAFAPRPKTAPDFAPFAFTDLATLFRESDVVSLHCPLTPENTGMINAALLSSMKKNAFLINTARGPLVNEADLADALEKGIIAGAGLDVVSVEPMPDSHPLRFAKNCLITPHVAWCSVEARTRLMQGVYDNIAAYIAGTPRNVKNGI